MKNWFHIGVPLLPTHPHSAHCLWVRPLYLTSADTPFWQVPQAAGVGTCQAYGPYPAGAQREGHARNDPRDPGSRRGPSHS